MLFTECDSIHIYNVSPGSPTVRFWLHKDESNKRRLYPSAINSYQELG